MQENKMFRAREVFSFEGDGFIGQTRLFERQVQDFSQNWNMNYQHQNECIEDSLVNDESQCTSLNGSKEKVVFNV